MTYIIDESGGYMRIFSIILLFISNFAMAANTDIEAYEIITEAQQLALKAKQVKSLNQEVIQSLSRDFSRITKQVTTLEHPSPEVRKVLQNCEENLNFLSEKTLNQLAHTYVAPLERNADRYYKDLSQNINLYLDSEEALKQQFVKSIMENMKSLRFNADKALDKEKLLNSFVTSEQCDFKELFEFEDSSDFDYFNRHIGATYSTSLSSTDILNTTYDETLDYILSYGPIKVERTTSRYGRASSVYSNNKVKMRTTYDYFFLTGIDNISHPEVGNVIKIIHRDRQ